MIPSAFVCKILPGFLSPTGSLVTQDQDQGDPKSGALYLFPIPWTDSKQQLLLRVPKSIPQKLQCSMGVVLLFGSSWGSGLFLILLFVDLAKGSRVGTRKQSLAQLQVSSRCAMHRPKEFPISFEVCSRYMILKLHEESETQLGQILGPLQYVGKV